jgi:DNA-binding NtrC family response regulator
MPWDVNVPTDNESAATILIVDDEPSVRQIISRWLAAVHRPSAQAENADAAWQYLQQHDVHVVTLDISMPGRSGADLLPQIKQHYPDTEVIMLTAHDDTSLVINTLTQGAFGYLIKPMLPEGNRSRPGFVCSEN